MTTVRTLDCIAFRPEALDVHGLLHHTEVERVFSTIFHFFQIKKGFWISSSSSRFSLNFFCHFGFRGCWTSATSVTSEGLGWKISIHGNFEPLGCTLSSCGSRWLEL